MTGGDPVDVAAVRRRVLDDHRETVAAVLSAAADVADGWDRTTTDDPSAVAGPLEAAIRRRGLDDRLVATLVDAVAATGRHLPADPVPHPPYLAVTSRGPVCRATLADGRLIVAVRAFRVERNRVGRRSRAVRYVRTGSDPERALDVTFATGGSDPSGG